MPCMGPTGRPSMMESIADRLFNKSTSENITFRMIEDSIYEARSDYYGVVLIGSDNRDLFCLILGILAAIPNCTKDQFSKTLVKAELSLDCADF